MHGGMHKDGLRWQQMFSALSIVFQLSSDVASPNESEREVQEKAPVKYHGKWPFKRVFGIRKPVSVAFSALNLSMQFHGWVSFFILLAVFHSRDVDITEKLDYSSAVALLGYTLILAILRTFNVREEAARVMVAAPLIAFVTTHILYLNFYKLDYGLNTKVCVGMGVAQLLLWAGWAGLSHHPSRWKLWVDDAEFRTSVLVKKAK
ncbi:hypothetical protein Syun_028874 [Stephania yunnanensis]|uniref:Post-GPI attachment to proteins factor 3 n=1 Tax=Stephania yunnanensis TaxID=152371 RepID=A0AAP0E6X7_9MAGN